MVAALWQWRLPWMLPSSSSLEGRFASAAAWSLLGTLLMQGSTLLASIAIARLLGKVQFGELGIVQGTVVMAGVFAGFGLGLTTSKHVAELRSSDPARAGRLIGVSLLLALLAGSLCAALLCWAAPWLAGRTLGAPHLAPELRLSSGLLVLNALSAVQTGALTGLEAFRTVAVLSSIRALAALPVLLAPVLLWGLSGAVCGLVAAAALACALNHVALGRACRSARIRVRCSGLFSEWHLLWSFSVPAFMSSAMTAPVNWAASAMLVQTPGGFAQMGIFSAANQWRSAVSLLPATLTQPALPMLSALYAARDLTSYRRLLLVNLRVVVASALALAAPTALLGPWIMRAYGSSYGEGHWVLTLLLAAAVLSASCAVIGQSIASSGKMWQGFSLNCLWALAFLAGARLGVVRWGALGLAAAALASYIVHTLAVSFYTATVVVARTTMPAPARPDCGRLREES